MHHNRKYIIIPTSEVTDDIISISINTNLSNTRKSLDGTKTILKFNTQVSNIFDAYQKCSHDEIIRILAGDEWNDNA